jgi:hypothetical protein
LVGKSGRLVSLEEGLHVTLNEYKVAKSRESVCAMHDSATTSACQCLKWSIMICS